MKKFFIASLILSALYSCGGNAGQQENKPAADNSPATSTATESNPTGSSDKGIGKFTDVKIDAALNKDMATKGQNVYDVKCSSCHKVTDERLVGPGWKGVTARHKPEWIMNFVTNVDEMLNKDPKAQAQLEVCLVRMPNQNLTDDDARNVYEFMRQVDGVK
ncbi:MAG: cytochrome c [Chitinophagaceae bacterium]